MEASRSYGVSCLVLVLGLGALVPEKSEGLDCSGLERGVKRLSRKVKIAKRKISNPKRKRKVVKRLKKKIRKKKRQLRICRSIPDEPFMEFVAVGEPGNADDVSDGDSDTMGDQFFGGVTEAFEIGKYEVTLEQYTTFLNAVATDDTYDLYSTGLSTVNAVKGIERTGDPGNRSYSVIGEGDKPVTYVNWFDAARFCNWLHNGMPSGAQDVSTTETGAYNLNGATTGIFGKEPGALYWIPDEDEWYKAAYFDARPEAEGGPTGDDNYWVYPTQNDFTPQPNNMIGPDPYQANFRPSPPAPNQDTYSVTQSTAFDPNQNYLTSVGSYIGTAGYFGTFDMGGNVTEWTDGVKDGEKVIRGGAWDSGEANLRAATRNKEDPAFTGSSNIGFRVAKGE